MQLSNIEYAKARFSTVAEVAQALRVSNMTVYRLFLLARPPAFELESSERFFTRHLR
ncbi:MAG: hypothetical protein ACLQRM_15455 [Acidimicrobiales bacterium]